MSFSRNQQTQWAISDLLEARLNTRLSSHLIYDPEWPNPEKRNDLFHYGPIYNFFFFFIILHDTTYLLEQFAKATA